MTEILSRNFADNLRIAKSRVMIDTAAGTYTIIPLPRMSLVKNVSINISRTWTASAFPTVTIGFIGNGETADPDAFMRDIDIAPAFTGYKSMINGNAEWSDGKYFDSKGGAITVTLGAMTATVKGIFVVFCDYTIIY